MRNNIDLLKQIGYTGGVLNNVAELNLKKPVFHMVTPWRETPAVFGHTAIRL
jgi:hypothetical protein